MIANWKVFSFILLVVHVALVGCTYNESSISINAEEDSPSSTVVESLNNSSSFLTLVEPIPTRPFQIVPSLQELGLQVSRQFTLPTNDPIWSHDGKLVAFSQLSPKGIFVVDTDTWQNPTNICTDNVNSSMAWSPDDSMIAFDSSNACEESTYCYEVTLRLCNLDTGQVTILPGIEGTLWSVLDWRENNLLLLLNDSFAIYDIEKQILRKLNLPGIDFNFQRTANFVDGSHIIYMTDGVRKTIQIVDIETLEVVEIVGSEDVENSAKEINTASVAIAPNERWISWLSKTDLENGNHETELKMYDLQTGKIYTLLDSYMFPGRDKVAVWSSPSWSPDSDRLIFIAEHTLWVLHLNENNL